jgi:outer membrane protein OmpA-like peptidoglycan-associated protein
VGADAALWGSVEGRWREEATPELLVTLRVSLVGDRTLLFAETARVRLAPNDAPEPAVRRAVLEAARPMLARLGDPGRKRCFDPERSRTLRRFAVAEENAARAAAAPPPAARPPAAPQQAEPPPASPPARAPLPAPARPGPKTPRAAEWAKKLGQGGRVIVEDLAFVGRSAAIQRDLGLSDLAAALAARPTLGVRIEGFVDTTSDRTGDSKLSAAMAQAAGRRLIELGVQKQRLSWTGRGGDSPVLPNFTARGRAANRRVEVVPVP